MDKAELLKPFENNHCMFAGPSGPISLRHIIEYFSEMVRQGITSDQLPESGLIGKIADRICGPTTKDCVIQLEGKKGSGKSTIAIEMAYQLSRAIAKRKGGTPDHYFNLNHVIVLSDARTIFETLQKIPDYSIIILDDLGIGANARESQTKDNISMGNILAVSRTKCWTIFTTSPLRSQVDKNVRLFADIVIRTYAQIPRVDDKPGFNLIKVHLVKLNPISQKEMTLNFIGKDSKEKKHKVNLYGVFYPPAHLIEPYNASRKEATNEVIRRIIENGGVNNKPKVAKRDRAEVLYENLTPEIKALILEGASTKSICTKLKCGEIVASRVVEMVNNEFV
jgi:hypothetical protein